MSTRKACGFLLSFVALFLLLAAAPALAIGLGVSPEKLNIEVSRGGSTSVTLGVTNTGNDESNYKVYVEEEEYKDWFSIEPEEFTLVSGENKAVEIDINPSADASGKHQAHICIVSMPPGEGLVIASGVKVLTTVSISALPSLPWIIGIGTAVIVAMILVIVLYRRRMGKVRGI